jgi:thiamine biosynthesis lipoprotein
MEVFERVAYVMGTRVRLAVVDDARARGLARLDRALGALEDAEEELSTWRPGGAIALLNLTPVGERWQASPHVCRMLTTVRHWFRESGGAFDPAIGALADAWGIHGDGLVPSDEAVARALERTGLRHFEFDRHRCAMTRRAEVRMDVGGFGKGEGLDRAAGVLGPGAWLIDLGGQISVSGAAPGASGWQVDIAHPANRASPLMSLVLASGSLSTSGSSERDLVVGGRRVGHILDPRTGRPAPFEGSVSVWHESALVADILSTALYVMGPREGIAWAEERGIAACYLESADGAIRKSMTAPFRARLAAAA